MSQCPRCDELLDELTLTRTALAAAREDASERRWERDHAQAAYERVRAELAALRAEKYAGGRRQRDPEGTS